MRVVCSYRFIVRDNDITDPTVAVTPLSKEGTRPCYVLKYFSLGEHVMYLLAEGNAYMRNSAQRLIKLSVLISDVKVLWNVVHLEQAPIFLSFCHINLFCNLCWNVSSKGENRLREM